MGNCFICRERKSATVWASVYDIEDDKGKPVRGMLLEKECLLAGNDDDEEVNYSVNGGGYISNYSSSEMGKMKVKISKKELEELMATARMEDVPLDCVFSRFITAVHHRLPTSRQHQHASWTPTLYTIAE